MSICMQDSRFIEYHVKELVASSCRKADKLSELDDQISERWLKRAFPTPMHHHYIVFIPARRICDHVSSLIAITR